MARTSDQNWPEGYSIPQSFMPSTQTGGSWLGGAGPLPGFWSVSGEKLCCASLVYIVFFNLSLSPSFFITIISLLLLLVVALGLGGRFKLWFNIKLFLSQCMSFPFFFLSLILPIPLVEGVSKQLLWDLVAGWGQTMIDLNL